MAKQNPPSASGNSNKQTGNILKWVIPVVIILACIAYGFIKAQERRNPDNVEAELNKNPLVATMKTTDPDIYKQLVSKVQAMMAEGKSVSDVHAEINPLVMKTIISKVPYASDDAVLNYARLSTVEYKEIRAANPPACYDYAFLGTDALKYLSKDTRQQESALSVELLKTYDKQKNVIDVAAAKEGVQILVKDLKEKFGNEVNLYANPPAAPTDVEKSKLCNMGIETFEYATTSMPKDKAVAMVRYMLSLASSHQ